MTEESQSAHVRACLHETRVENYIGTGTEQSQQSSRPDGEVGESSAMLMLDIHEPRVREFLTLDKSFSLRTLFAQVLG